MGFVVFSFSAEQCVKMPSDPTLSAKQLICCSVDISFPDIHCNTIAKPLFCF